MNDLVRKLSAEGCSMTEIGRQIGKSRHAVKRHMMRVGIAPTSYESPIHTCRSAVQDMKSADAIEYLLDFIERAFANQRPDLVAQVVLSVKIPPQMAKVLLQLSNGRLHPRDSLLDGLCVGKTIDTEPGVKIVDVYICHIRKLLLNRNWPVEIKTLWGKGYIMVRNNPKFQFPWEALDG